MQHSLLAHARAKQDELISFLRDLVECESPSDDPQSVQRCFDLIADHVADIATVHRGPQLVCDFHLPGSDKESQILFLGHADTVYPPGTLATMPFRINGDRIHGPGVFDMKGGLAIVIFAMRSLIELNIPVRRKVVLEVVADEEIGSHGSRAFTEEMARKSAAVIVAEPSAGEDGKAKTSRKGVGGYSVTAHGRSAHAGLDFNNGANAILELSHQLLKIAAFTDLTRGLTVSAGIIRGGTRTNVVPAEATCDFDIRVSRAADWEEVDAKFRSLQTFDPRCTLQIDGELNRPPLERNDANLALYETASRLATETGVPLGETAVGGGSDGNFTSALGIPTLDGMGAVGDGAHTPGEYILASRIADRVALLAALARTL